MRFEFSLATLITMTCASVAAAQTWHVAPENLTGLPPDAQVRTISEAAAKAGPGDTVVIHAGIYRETVTVEKSGTKESPIRFEAAPGENVVITGADVIRTWTKEPGGQERFQRTLAAPLHRLEQVGHASRRRQAQDDRPLRAGLHSWLPSASGA